MVEQTWEVLASGTRRAVRRLLRSPAAVGATAILLLIAACALVPDLVATHAPEAVDPTHTLLAPGGDHLFGTDQLGRDLFSRVVHSARPSVLVALAATVSALLVGSLVGLVSGFAGGWIDSVLMRAVDVLLAFPPLLLALAVVGILGSSVVNVAIAVGIAGVAPFCRMVRAQVLHVRARPFVDAATVGGVQPVAILFRHIIPNAAGPVLLLGLMGLGVSMLASSSLSFLGFGPTPPATDWGALAAAGRDYVGTAWWLTTFPGVSVVLTVLAATTLYRVVQRPVGYWL
ncbi:MAG: ABC transporter permease [Pseudonocardiaceae bacterium]